MNDLFIQVRLDSKRLFKKAFLNVLDQTLLEYTIERCLLSDVDRVIVVTSDEASDDPIFEFCKNSNIACFRGSKYHVLDRFYQAAQFYNSDTIVRVTADCPLIDWSIIDQALVFFNQHDYDYVSTDQQHDLPRGLDVEVFSKEALLKTHQQCQDPSEQEHVTLFMKNHPEEFKLHFLDLGYGRADLRLTVDTQQDFELIEKIISHFYPSYPQYTFDDILELLEKNTSWVHINQEVQQKSPYD